VRRSHEQGFTLVELLLAIAIMGIVFVAVFTGFATFFRVSVAQRANADMDAYLRQYVEKVSSPQTPYVPCATSYTLPVAVPGFSVSAATVAYWDAGTYQPATFSPPGTCTIRPLGGASITTGERALTAATGGFTTADIGARVFAPGVPCGTTIEAVAGPSTATMSDAATQSGSGVPTSLSSDTCVQQVTVTIVHTYSNTSKQTTTSFTKRAAS